MKKAVRIDMAGSAQVALPGKIISAGIYSILTAMFCKLLIINGAGEGNRTLVSSLGSWRSAIELHPHCQSHERTCRRLFSLLFHTPTFFMISESPATPPVVETPMWLS
jgi:hypothetical protein